MKSSQSGTAKTNRKTRKQARKLTRSSPSLSQGIQRSLQKNFKFCAALERDLRSSLRREHLEDGLLDILVADISKLALNVSQSNWIAREQMDRRRSTKRTKHINGILKTIARLEKKLSSSDFDKFPEDWLAQEKGRNLKTERLQALHSLRDNLQSIKGKVGQRNELKRSLALHLRKLFASHQIKCKKNMAFSAFESTFQAICKHLDLRVTENVWHFLRKT